jgi:hypothetical protein
VRFEPTGGLAPSRAFEVRVPPTAEGRVKPEVARVLTPRIDDGRIAVSVVTELEVGFFGPLHERS